MGHIGCPASAQNNIEAKDKDGANSRQTDSPAFRLPPSASALSLSILE
jgi:hypothetical protein